MMLRYYLNPFKRQFMKIAPEEINTARVMSLGPGYAFEEYLTLDEIWDVFHTLYNTRKCFGKFDLFAKFVPVRMYFSSSDGIDTKERVKVLSNLLMTKPGDVCYKCDKMPTCGLIRTSLLELEVLWDQIYFNRADQFKEQKTWKSDTQQQ